MCVGPGISVVIPALNASGTLGAQLDAVLAQDGVLFEVLVADNGSTDGTQDLIREYADQDPRVRFVDAASEPLGGAAAKNLGVRLSRSPILAFCDADDVVRPGWLRAVHDGLREHPWVNVTREFWSLNPGYREAGFPETMLQEGLRGGAFGMTRELYLHAGSFDPDFPGPVDTEFGLRVETSGVQPTLLSDAVISVRVPTTFLETFQRRRTLARPAHLLRISHPQSHGSTWRRWALIFGWLCYKLPLLATPARLRWAQAAGSLLGDLEGTAHYLCRSRWAPAAVERHAG